MSLRLEHHSDAPPDDTPPARRPAGSERWWLHPHDLVTEITRSRRAPMTGSCYRFGDGFLLLDSDYGPLNQELRQLYHDCAVPASAASGGVCVSCTVRAVDEPPLVLVSVRAQEPPDSVGLALSLLLHEHPLDGPRKTEGDSPSPGWRLICNPERPTPPLLITQGPHTLFARRRETPTLLALYLVSGVMSTQRGVLFVHAGSVGLRGAGVLLVGATRAGKTTSSLTLASRGHALLGDDVAAVRIGSGELLPFRQTTNIREGPRARSLDGLLGQISHQPELTTDGMRRVRVRAGELFPGPAPGPVTLRSAFFLRRLAGKPRVEPFTPSADDIELLKPLAYEPTVNAAWGASPGRRVMKFLLLVELLSRARCYLLDLGSPEETADMIEQTTEDSWA